MKNLNKTPKVSVIIPCYNNAIFIKECLESVVNQTFSDIEIIVINDGSTDESAEIIQSYANKDKRIVFINRKNKGVAYSLNEGIRRSSGEYITFLDSDDYYDLNHINNTYQAAKENDLDLVGTNCVEFTGSFKDNSFQSRVLSCTTNNNQCNIVLDGNEPFTMVRFIHRWRTLFRRSLITGNNIIHNEKQKSCEDVSFYMETMLLARRIMFLNYIGVYHRKDNKNSITKDAEGLRKNFFDAHNFTKNQLIKRGFWDNKREALIERCIGNLKFALTNIPFEHHIRFIIDYSEHLKDISEDISTIEKNNFFFIDTHQSLIEIIHTPLDWYNRWSFENYKVSVIMPVYNAEKYLRNALNSIISQTIKEIEIILIDDGSTDSSSAIMNEYAKLDDRVIVLQQENKGAGAARNLGLQHAHGAYLSFLDADDYFYPTMLEEAFKKACLTQADIVWYKCEEQDVQKNELISLGYYFARDGANLPDKEIFQFNKLKNNPFFQVNGWAWDRLFNRNFVLKNNLRFNATPVSNDSNFTYLAMAKAHRITTINKILLRRIVGHGDNISLNKHDAHPEVLYNNFAKLYKDIKEISSVLAKQLTAFLVENISWQFCEAITLDKSAEVAFDIICGDYLKEIGFHELSEDDMPVQFKDRYYFAQRILEYAPGQFKEFKDSLVNYPITINENGKNRELSFCPGRKTNAKIIFKQKAEIGKNTAVPFFSLKLEEWEHKTAIAKIEFTYLDNNMPAVYDTLYLGACVRIVNDSAVLDIYQAEWEHGRKSFTDNIYYTLKNSTITFYCKYTAQYTGFEYRILSMSSREDNGNSIILSLISNGGLSLKMAPLPQDARAITSCANKNSGEHTVVFKIDQPQSQTVLGAPLFRITLPNEDNKYCTTRISFAQINANNEPTYYANLQIGINYSKSFEAIAIHQLEWDKKSPLNELIYFAREKHSLVCYGKFTGKNTGYYFRTGDVPCCDETSNFELEAYDDYIIELLPSIPTVAITANPVPATEVLELVECLAEVLDEIDCLKEQNNELADRLLKIEAKLAETSQTTNAAKVVNRGIKKVNEKTAVSSKKHLTK